jgi:hypothetical protein
MGKQQRIFGLGLDNQDGHTRVTKTKNVILKGGSEETHEKMQEISIRFEEKLKGKSLTGMDQKEVIDRIKEAVEKSS